MVCSALRWAVVWLRVVCVGIWVLMVQSWVEVQSKVGGWCVLVL